MKTHVTCLLTKILNNRKSRNKMIVSGPHKDTGKVFYRSIRKHILNIYAHILRLIHLKDVYIHKTVSRKFYRTAQYRRIYSASKYGMTSKNNENCLEQHEPIWGNKAFSISLTHRDRQDRLVFYP